MPDWHEILDEIKQTDHTLDGVRRKYLKKLHDVTGRNVVIYYSGWLQSPGVLGTAINDADKNGFMTVINKLDRSKGLDLLLHTPGGDSAATESLVDYLLQLFGTDIRAIVPQLAMSGGTLISCACKSIVMGKQSSLGPIDPQLNGIAAHGIIEEFEQAHREIIEDPKKLSLWQPIIAKYHPTLIGECTKAINWMEELAKEWLSSNMLAGCESPEDKAEEIIKELGDHAITKSHARHLSAQKCRGIGLNIECLEDSPELQDAVLSVHHACIHTFSASSAYKIIENQNGVAFIQNHQQALNQ